MFIAINNFTQEFVYPDKHFYICKKSIVYGQEVKEIHDLYKGLHVVLSGSSLIQLNDGQSDLSRRADVYDMAGLSFREYIWFRTGKEFEPVLLERLLENPNGFPDRQEDRHRSGRPRKGLVANRR